MFIDSVHKESILITNYNNFKSNNNEMICNFNVPNVNSVIINFKGFDKIIGIINNKIIKLNNNEKTFIIKSNQFQLQIPRNLENFSIEIIPNELTPKQREEIFIQNFPTFIKYFKFMNEKWNQKIDESLLKIINQSKTNNIQIKSLNLATNPILQGIPNSLIMSRIELINRLNNTIVRILKLIELGDYQPLSQSIISVRSSISTTQKLILFRKRVITHLDENPRLNLKFNRSRAERSSYDKSKTS